MPNNVQPAVNPLGIVLQAGSRVEELKQLLLRLHRRSVSGVAKERRKSTLQSPLPCLTVLKCLHVKRQEEKGNT